MISTYKGRKVKENSLKRNANNLWGFDTSDYDLVNLFNQCQKKKRKEKKEIKKTKKKKKKNTKSTKRFCGQKGTIVHKNEKKRKVSGNECT